MVMRYVNKQGQSLVEYALMISVALLVIIGTQIWFAGALRGRWKRLADQAGAQFTSSPETAVAIETRQLSIRTELTGDPLLISDSVDTVWNESRIVADPLDLGIGDFTEIQTAFGSESVYIGHEATHRDYVDAVPGGGEVGTHSFLDRGQISSQKLFDDD